MNLFDLMDAELLGQMLDQRYVSSQYHPSAPLQIFNYTHNAQYDRVWNEVTKQCRGLIVHAHTKQVVARPWSKFFNYGEHPESGTGDLPTLDLLARCAITDKMDGSLGILYYEGDGYYSIATRGSFTSEQAIHATQILRHRYSTFRPFDGATYLFEIIYPTNRIVLDYGDLDDLVLLDVLETETGRHLAWDKTWPGPRAERMPGRTLADALALPMRTNAEGVVVRYEDGLMVKIKQEDYVALHRILTGTNARNVWEVSAVQACRGLIAEPKHWATFLGIDPARAEEILNLGDDWLQDLPDEFYGWVEEIARAAMDSVDQDYAEGLLLADAARKIADRAERFSWLDQRIGTLITPVMRIASSSQPVPQRLLDDLRLRCWRMCCPEPTAPFVRSEDIA